MKYIAYPNPPANNYRAALHHEPRTRLGRRLIRHYRISPSTADLLAIAAGFAGEGR